MGFLATLVGLTSVERFIPLATPETERRDVLSAKPAPPRAAGAREAARAAARESTSRTAENRASSRAEPAPASTGARPRPRARCRSCRIRRCIACWRRSAPACRSNPPRAGREARAPRSERPATIKPKKAPSTITQTEHVVIADAVRLLGWGRQWHELAEMISRLAERPRPRRSAGSCAPTARRSTPWRPGAAKLTDYETVIRSRSRGAARLARRRPAAQNPRPRAGGTSPRRSDLTRRHDPDAKPHEALSRPRGRR